MSKQLKILITGTHFTPAQALIRQLGDEQNIKIYYLGRKTTMEGDKTHSAESQVLPKLGVHFIPIISGRIQKTLTPLTILSLLKIPIGLVQSLYWLSKIKPVVVIAFGGYTSIPVVISAWLLSVPILVHQQTMVANLSASLSNLFADKIALSFPRVGQTGSKQVLTGNPVRGELLRSLPGFKNPQIGDFLARYRKNGGKLLLITGGNQGSHIINQQVAKILPQLVQNFWVIHQTGESKYQDFDQLVVEKSKLDLEHRYFPIKWIEAPDLGKILQQTNLALSRGGINTLLELFLFKVPTLVVPLPNLSHDEQLVNAKYFAKQGWVNILPQSELAAEKLLTTVGKLDQESSKMKNNFQGPNFDLIYNLVMDADKRLALEVMLLAHAQMVTSLF